MDVTSLIAGVPQESREAVAVIGSLLVALFIVWTARRDRRRGQTPMDPSEGGRE